MNYKKLYIIFFTQFLFGQSINGHFPEAKSKEIVLKIYDGFAEKEISQTVSDSLGSFKLSFPKEYKGAGLLQVKDAGNVIVLLNKESFTMHWDSLQHFSTLRFVNSFENEAFTKGMQLNQKINQKFSALKYLLPLYEDEVDKKKWLISEIKKQDQIFENFINTLPDSSFVKNYLSYRKFLDNMQLTHDNYKDVNRVIVHESGFKKINFSNDALWHSGLLKEILNSFYQLLELYADERTINSHAIEANKVWVNALERYPLKQQEVAQFCFNQLDTRNHVEAAEFIAISMLSKSNCQLTELQVDLFEQYRKLAIGAVAPEIIFSSSLKAENDIKQLSTIDKSYKLVVFGSSWCPNCQTDYPSLVGKYNLLKEKHDLEIVYISIDSDLETFKNYYKEAPFITYCDAKGWETQAARDYHVFATPTYILLDRELKILAKIKSPEHLQAWLESR
jgi:hypothetical protein